MATKESQYGILIDYEFCTNCHTCEVACKKVLDLPIGQYGIKVLEDGPRKNTLGKWEWTYVPLLTDLCDLCADRVVQGRLPSCVHHCQSGIMYYGTLEELVAKQAEKPKQVLFSK
jgi:Fe-S-cluster-containing dehydrogenase component